MELGSNPRNISTEPLNQDFQFQAQYCSHTEELLHDSSSYSFKRIDATSPKLSHPILATNKDSVPKGGSSDKQNFVCHWYKSQSLKTKENNGKFLAFSLATEEGGAYPFARPETVGGVSSVGRASAWHAEGQRFESATLHHFTDDDRPTVLSICHPILC